MAKKPIPIQGYSAVASLPSLPSTKSIDLLRSYRAWVYTAINSIAEDVGAINLKLYGMTIKKGGDVEINEVPEHYASSLLHYVNDFMTLPMLLEITTVYLKLMGECYWAKLRNNAGEVEELWPLRPDWVKVIPSETKYIGGYIYKPAGVSERDAVHFDVKDIVPFKELNPSNAYRGYSATMAGAMAIDTDYYSSNWNRTFFLNSAIPGLVFTSEKKLNKATIDRFMKDWLSAFKGAGNAHKVAFLGGGMKVDKVTNTVQEMDFRGMKKDLRDEILAMYRVPKVVLGISEDANKASADATIRSYIRGVVTPQALKIVTHLNEFLLNDYRSEKIRYFFDFDDPAPKDTELDLKVYESGIKYYWMTPNEVREKENLPPVEGGDVIYVPVKTSTLENETADKFIKLEVKKGSLKPKVFRVPLPVATLSELKQKSIKEGFKHDLHKLILAVATEKKAESVENFAGLFSAEKSLELLKVLTIQANAYEGRWVQELNKLFNEQMKEVLSNLENIKFYKKTLRRGKEASFVFNLEDAVKEWRDVFAPMILDIFARELKNTLDLLGLDITPNTETDTSLEFLEDIGLEFTQTVNETTIEKIKDTLREGFASEESIASLRARVSEVFEGAVDSRSVAISATEVRRGINYAVLEGYRQSGIVTGKQWVTSGDSGVCAICDSLSGKIVGLEEDFGLGVGKVPPAHPRCRCVLSPAIIEKKKKVPKLLSDRVVERLADKVTEKERADGEILEAETENVSAMTKLKNETEIKIGEIQKLADDTVSNERKELSVQLRTIKNKIGNIVAERQNE